MLGFGVLPGSCWCFFERLGSLVSCWLHDCLDRFFFLGLLVLVHSSWVFFFALGAASVTCLVVPFVFLLLRLFFPLLLTLGLGHVPSFAWWLFGFLLGGLVCWALVLLVLVSRPAWLKRRGQEKT